MLSTRRAEKEPRLCGSGIVVADSVLLARSLPKRASSESGAAGPPAKLAAPGPIGREFRAKRLLHGAGGPGQHQGAAAQTLLLHLEPVPPRQVEEHLHVGSVSAVGICEGTA